MGASVQVLPREPARVSTSGADPARSPPPERGSHQPTRPTRLEDSNLRAEQDWDRPLERLGRLKRFRRKQRCQWLYRSRQFRRPAHGCRSVCSSTRWFTGSRSRWLRQELLKDSTWCKTASRFLREELRLPTVARMVCRGGWENCVTTKKGQADGIGGRLFLLFTSTPITQ